MVYIGRGPQRLKTIKLHRTGTSFSYRISFKILIICDSFFALHSHFNFKINIRTNKRDV